MTNLRDLSPLIEDSVNDLLGDEITYTPAGGSADTFNAWVEFDNEELRAPGSASTARVFLVEVPKARVPVVDKEGDRISIKLLPDMVFKPARIENGETGETHRITLMAVR
jgi:hypothetical protein